MKKLFSLIATICTLLTLTSCNKFLDVHPNDSILAEQVLTNQTHLHSTLTGIYMNMANSTTYGAALTTTVVETLGQRYDMSRHTEASVHKLLQQYVYDEAATLSMFGGIWEAMYSNILQINYFIGLVNEMTVHITETQKRILLGEAYGLRAMHHFDLLRLWGPVPGEPTDKGIMPYMDIIRGTAQKPLLSAEDIMDRVIEDLKTAEDYLKDTDPVIRDGIVKTMTPSVINNFYLNRHHRLNFYAVKALQARAYMWQQKPNLAAQAAQAVIDGQEWFPWVTHSTATRHQDPDLIFSSEVIFGVRNLQMYNLFRSSFAANLQNEQLLNPRETRMLEVYNDGNDIRFIRTWGYSPSRPEQTCFKYAEPNGTHDTTFGYFQPLIRISEMYLILAEANQSAEPLMELRNRRFLGDRDWAAGSLSGQIEAEYRREFWAEGQIFFFYKRRFQEAIPNANTDNTTISMTNQHYQIPLPSVEQAQRWGELGGRPPPIL
jgi:hypothetical protein